MDASTSDVARLLLRDIAGFERELELFPDEESVWKTMPGVPNSAGNLALHLAGNLRQFVGGARRALTGDPRSSHPVSLTTLCD